MNRAEIQEVLNQIDYKGWTFLAQEPDPGTIYLQITFVAPDSDTRECRRQHCRKWLLSRHMTRSEVVTTALKAVLTAEEHEAREAFRYQGHAIFGPHIDVEALLAACASKDAREAVSP